MNTLRRPSAVTNSPAAREKSGGCLFNHRMKGDKMKYLLLLAPLIMLSACTTPKTMLKHPKTGQVAICGGDISSSITGGAFGYHLQKGNDAECKADYLSEGFEIIKEEERSN